MAAADPSDRPVTRWDARLAWMIAGASALVVGAYFRLEAKVAAVSDRTTVIETRQLAQDETLRGIERAVSRIEGRLGVDPVSAGRPGK